ncbi:FAD-dependent oxidoreductase [Fretibacter rubidus]|uniref:FAD-dependent oxidoreductase n=1 Tax=Fretibacter rubidus TaxID=570162 RepID=UPI00352AE324
MIIDAAQTELPEIKDADVCIIGGGVAGQTLAMRLAAQKQHVVLLESGGRDFDPQTQKLSEGENIGAPYYDLETTRLRLFGGTAAIWGGRCAELDPIDFKKRDFIPHSGWPISKSDLDPYYARAFDSLGLARPGEGRLWDTLNRQRPAFDPNKLEADLWCFDENGERFTNPTRGNLSDIEIVLNATMTELDVGPSGAVQSVSVQTPNKASARIKAKTFVLAAGAIETTRLLMGAVPARPKGLGNDHGQLGRYFMEHPHARGGQIIPHSLAQSLMVLPRALRSDGRRYAAYLRPAERLQEELGILNTSISFAPRRHAGGTMELFRAATNKLKHDLPSTKFWRSLYKGLKGAAIRGLEWTDPWASVMNMKLSRGKLGLYAVVRAEQAPNPDSRVTLSPDKDAFGLPLAALDWQLSELDKHSVTVLMKTLGEEYERLGWGIVEPAAWLSDETQKWAIDPLISAHPIGGYHHMGGTRMGDDPTTSVVDKNGRLHASPNLYIASSSVFPTSGWANPTVTIMALAERLGDHIASHRK